MTPRILAGLAGLALATALAACGAASAPAVATKPAAVRTAAKSKAAPAATKAAVKPAAPSEWKLKWQADFNEAAPLGSFSGCNGSYNLLPGATCTGLPADLQSQWWAYPTGWPDSSTNADKPVHGYYSPGTVVSISGGEMHVRMYRTTGFIHSAAVLPKAAIGMTYGKYVETFEVSADSDDGYRSSDLLWPTDNLPSVGDEIDFPEGEWDSQFCAHVHSLLENDGRDVANFCPDVGYSDWNTTVLEWAPGSLKFYLNGTLIGSLTGKWAPTTPMSWILQNEGALYGPEAAVNSSAQMNISSVAVYSYQGPS